MDDKEDVMETELREAIESAINRCCAENESNTPDFILAEYLTGCLAAFDKAVGTRDRWYGIAPEPGWSHPTPSPPDA